MIITVLSVLAAFSAVFGMLCFLAYCGRSFDAEARKVEEAGR